MPESINISQLLELRKNFLVLDTRSEGEYEHAHIPGAISLPLLNNEERAKVGTCYKQKGREEAVLLGFDLVGHKFGEYIRKAKQLTNHPSQPSPKERGHQAHMLTEDMGDGKIPPSGGGGAFILYCWRGGLRSNTMAWLLEKAGVKVYVLEGGYKTFRHWALNEFAAPLQLLVLGGKTGSGKTEILHEMKNAGEQFIDLEGLANHRGSAYGALGQPPQPSSEQFENQLALELIEVDRKKILWLENESSKIGGVKIPDGIYNKMREANVMELEIALDKRIENIVRVYADFPHDKLAEATKKIETRLGNERMKNALTFLEEKDYTNWVRLLLEYYDKAYTHSKQQRKPETIFTLEVTETDNKTIAKQVIDFSNKHVNT